MPTLINGREVKSTSEDWRHECEARMIVELPTLQQRREYLDVVDRRRGMLEADALRETMGAIWAARKEDQS